MARQIFGHAFLCAVAALTLILGLPPANAAGQKASDEDRHQPRLLVLDNSDSDFEIPPFDDSVLFLNSQGKIINSVGGLNICQTVGRARAIAASEDGSFFVVCENVADQITAYDASSGEVLWSLPGKFGAATIVGQVIYALVDTGTIHGDSVLTISADGKITNEAKLGGYDIVVDSSRDCFWLVGSDIKKCNMNLQAVQTLDVIGWCAVSVDLSPDGSIWVAERRHSQAGKQNRLLHIAPEGTISKTIPLKDVTPMCVRVDKSDGSVWVTGREFRFAYGPPRKWVTPQFWRSKWKDHRYTGPRTRKYSAQGELLLELKTGGDSIDIDPSDGSVWIAGKSRVSRYSAKGRQLAKYSGGSNDDKWITVVRGSTGE